MEQKVEDGRAYSLPYGLFELDIDLLLPLDRITPPGFLGLQFEDGRS